jgi:hypothetical protein
MVLCFNMISQSPFKIQWSKNPLFVNMNCWHDLITCVNTRILNSCSYCHKNYFSTATMVEDAAQMIQNYGWQSDTFLQLDVQWVGNSNEPSCLYSLATILFGTEPWGLNMSPLLMDIGHATINRKDIYSLLNNGTWPRTWIPVSDCNSISLNDMVPTDTWFWLSCIIWHINVFKQYITSYPTKLIARTRPVPSQTFPRFPVLKAESQILSVCATENCLQHHGYVASTVCKKVEGMYVLCRFSTIM